MHPNTTKGNKRWVWGPIGWIGCVCCENIWHNFVAQTFALIAPVQTILHQVSCSNKMMPNAAKRYKTHQNLNLGSNGMDWVRSLRKNYNVNRGMNFCIKCANSPRFAPSLQLRNDSKCTQTLWNARKHEFRVQWGGSSAFVAKNYNVTSWHELLH